jgi:hypothetical protein
MGGAIKAEERVLVVLDGKTIYFQEGCVHVYACVLGGGRSVGCWIDVYYHSQVLLSYAQNLARGVA